MSSNRPASWKWYSAMDEAIGSRPSITPPALVASSGPDVAVASSSSVITAPVSKKRKGGLTDLRERAGSIGEGGKKMARNGGDGRPEGTRETGERGETRKRSKRKRRAMAAGNKQGGKGKGGKIPSPP
ncbi:hypothetical protein M9458_056954 [Cirrhinus mrigala]|uniref:Uncharacterized protein n=1 Tax=Cirrhinus mrigala TaxID=683832 RepID=A0ABD0MFB7_CIRMR